MISIEEMHTRVKSGNPDKHIQMQNILKQIEELWYLNGECEFGEIVESILYNTGKDVASDLSDEELEAHLIGIYYRA